MIHFPRADFWVARRSLPKYTRWAFRRHVTSGGGWRGVGQYFWCPSARNPVPADVMRLLDRASSLGVRPGWMHGHSDGTRIQVFDRGGDRVAQLSLGGSGRCAMRREIWARQRVGDLAPRILKRASDGTEYVEERVSGRLMPPSPDLLRMVVKQLRAQFYKPREIPFGRFLQVLRCGEPLQPMEEDALQAVESLLGDRSVSVSWVHGDLWSGNVLKNQRGKYVLLDWEYTRRSMVTADEWFYLYHSHRQQGQDGVGFYATLAQLFRVDWDIRNLSEIRAWHLLHLVERHLFLRRLDAPRSGDAAAVLEKDIRAALAVQFFPRIRRSDRQITGVLAPASRK